MKYVRNILNDEDPESKIESVPHHAVYTIKKETTIRNSA